MTRQATTRAIVMAAGRGTRMQRADPAATLDDAQARVAGTGLKALIPVAGGRPFLDYVLASLADAGLASVCLVIGPSAEHEAIRRRYTRDAPPERLALAFAVQAAPRGAADAVLAGESFAAGETVLVVNADNLYPVPALRALAAVGVSAVAGFDREALVRESNIDPGRIAQYALLAVDAAGHLARIVEKPSAAEAATFARDARVSMNLWSFRPAIFEACRRVTPSPRGELELPSAVQLARDALGETFVVVPVSGGVLDLSSRGDIQAVTERLAGFAVHY